MQWFNELNYFSALLLNIVFHATIVSGSGWMLIKLFKHRSAIFKRNLVMANLLCLLFIPVVTIGFMNSGLMWNLPSALISKQPDFNLEKEMSGQTPVDRMPAYGMEFSGIENKNNDEQSVKSPVLAKIKTPQNSAKTDSRRSFSSILSGSISYLWIAVSTILLIRVIYGRLVLLRFKKVLAPIRNPRIEKIVKSIREEFQVNFFPLIYVSKSIGTPITIQFRKPSIVLPHDLCSLLSDEELKAVLRHEFAHIAQNDLFWGVLQRVISALYWWNPFVHFINARFIDLIEEIADICAIQKKRNSFRYAECLLNIAEKSCRVPSLPGALEIRHPRQTLECRIRNLLSKEIQMETVMKKHSQVGIYLSFILITFFTACVQVATTPEKVIKEDKIQPVVEEATMVSEDPAKEDEIKDGFVETEIEPPAKHPKYIRRNAKKGVAPSQIAVEKGLDWLKRHQHSDGYWDCDNYISQCKEVNCKSVGHSLNDVGVTGIALLAFLGAGNTPISGPYKDVVRKGVEYLCIVQNLSDGCLAPKSFEHYMYNHGIACLALLECYGLSNYTPIKKSAEKALEFIHKSKNQGKAWRYNTEGLPPDMQNDVSVTTWMLLCLVSARDFDFPYHQTDIEDGIAFIKEMTDKETGRTGYMNTGSYSSRELGDELVWPFENTEALTAAGMMCRIFCEQNPDDDMLKKGAALLMKKPPTWKKEFSGVDYHYCYYGTNAMYQVAGKDWVAWKKNILELLLPLQKTEGCLEGSWDPTIDPWGDMGGRVYSTALCVLCMETFYRYSCLLKK